LHIVYTPLTCRIIRDCSHEQFSSRNCQSRRHSISVLCALSDSNFYGLQVYFYEVNYFTFTKYHFYCGKLSGNWVKREDFEWEPLKHSFILDMFLTLHCTPRCWRIYGDGTCNGLCIQDAVTLAARHGSE